VLLTCSTSLSFCAGSSLVVWLVGLFSLMLFVVGLFLENNG